jgi:hypothetical protein
MRSVALTVVSVKITSVFLHVTPQESTDILEDPKDGDNMFT